MPLYEYACLDCRTLFDALRSMQAADDPIACEACGSLHTERTISLFFAHGQGGAVASGGCACASGGSCGCAN